MTAPVDVSEGSRELVDLSAEAINSLGQHLSQIGDIIANATLCPKKGDRGAAQKLKDKLELYKAYSEEVMRRKAVIEAKQKEDFERLRAWRKQTGTEGASLVEEMETLYIKVREMGGLLKQERQRVWDGHRKVQELLRVAAVKEHKLEVLADKFVQRTTDKRLEAMQRAGVCSWLQVAFSDMRYKWKAEQERERLKLEHHRKMRKARATARLDVVQRERAARMLQACVMAIQEEGLEGRRERHLEEIRRRYEDHVLVLDAQLAQAMGDEDKAKELVAEQVRRMEEAKRQAREAEKQAKLAKRDARAARDERDKALAMMRDAQEAQAAAEARADKAEKACAEAQADAANSRAEADASNAARAKAEKGQRDAEEQVRKKAKKIQSMQRILAEVGAESDSDAPPDERPPAFFVNEDGSKAPRPRTRKERMGMAYREAESARWELRLGMAAIIDRDINSSAEIDRLRTNLETAQHEVAEVRAAHEALAVDAEASAGEVQRLKSVAEAAAEAKAAAEARAAELLAVPTSPSTGSLGPTAPVFLPAPKVELPSPRFLLKTASQPAFMAPLPGEGGVHLKKLPEKLAPLRRRQRGQLGWDLGWH
mmetsp:Transcript_122314/g.346796  ORF Transcript_122314/g.346796 Transcript_122314/m.346796 type:complete len:597 (-) Transcript_122314:58-1848(-)